MDDPACRARLETLAQSARRFLEPHWRCWRAREGNPRGPLSRGVCDRSSLFLARLLQAEGLAARFAIGAPAMGPYGYLWNGVWQGHAWVVCEGLVADITADQFDGGPVRIVPADDGRYREGEDVADVEIALMREHAVDLLLKRWQAQDVTTECGAAFAPLGS